MKTWLKQWWCGFRGAGHSKRYRTKFQEGDLFPFVICESYCIDCGKVLHKAIGCDWGHPIFNTNTKGKND